MSTRVQKPDNEQVWVSICKRALPHLLSVDQSCCLWIRHQAGLISKGLVQYTSSNSGSLCSASSSVKSLTRAMGYGSRVSRLKIRNRCTPTHLSSALDWSSEAPHGVHGLPSSRGAPGNWTPRFFRSNATGLKLRQVTSICALTSLLGRQLRPFHLVQQGHGSDGQQLAILPKSNGKTVSQEACPADMRERDGKQVQVEIAIYTSPTVQ